MSAEQLRQAAALGNGPLSFSQCPFSMRRLAWGYVDVMRTRPSAVASTSKDGRKIESPQMRVGSGGASSMPPQQRNSIEINAPGEWKP